MHRVVAISGCSFRAVHAVRTGHGLARNTLGGDATHIAAAEVVPKGRALQERLAAVLLAGVQAELPA